jgi:hypothetical protein
MINGTIRIAMVAVAIVILIFSRFQKTIFSHDFAVRLKRSFAFFVISLVMPIIYGKDNVKQMVIFLVAMTIGYLFTLFIRYDDFKELFLLIIRFLSIYSLITFVIGNIFSSDFLSFLPIFERKGSLFFNFGLSVYNFSLAAPRNYGIFWEPGTFSIFLCVALYIELFEKTFNIKRILLLVVTIVSTVSTLGIICMVMLFAAFILTDNNFISARLKMIVAIGCVFAFIITLIYGQAFLYQTFSKLDMSGSTVNDSTAVRINAILYPGSAFLGNPTFGVGYDKYLLIQERFCDNMATCSFINWLCLFGIVGGSVPIIGAIRYFVVNEHSFMTKCILFVFSLCLFSTENCTILIFMYIVFFSFADLTSAITILTVSSIDSGDVVSLVHFFVIHSTKSFISL